MWRQNLTKLRSLPAIGGIETTAAGASDSVHVSAYGDGSDDKKGTGRQLSGDCPTTCYSYDCDYWVPEGYSCEQNEEQYGCDCSGCACDGSASGGGSPPSSCPATCDLGYDCDYWYDLGYSCSSSEDYGCDCSGCACGATTTYYSATYYGGGSEGCLTVKMMDAYGDGWFGDVYTLVDAKGDAAGTGTLTDGAAETDYLCDLPNGCYTMVVLADGALIDASEVSWEIAFDGVLLAAGGSPATVAGICTEGTPTFTPTITIIPTATLGPTSEISQLNNIQVLPALSKLYTSTFTHLLAHRCSLCRTIHAQVRHISMLNQPHLSTSTHAGTGTDGPSWTNKNGWFGSSDPCSFAGVGCNDAGEVVKLDLAVNSLQGHLPTQLGDLTSLTSGGNVIETTSLLFRSNTLTGTMPSEIGRLTAMVQGL